MNLYKNINTIIELQDIYADIMLGLHKCEITPLINYYESTSVANKAFLRMHIYIEDMESIEIKFIDNVLRLNGNPVSIKDAKIRLQNLKDMLTTLEEIK